MSIRIKIFLALSGVAFLLWVATAWLANDIFRDGFRELDRRQMLVSAGRVGEAIERDTAALGEALRLWVMDREDLQAGRAPERFLETADANLLGFIDAGGRVAPVFFRHTMGDRRLPPADAAAILGFTESGKETEGTVRGAAMLLSGPFMLAAAPTGDADSPVIVVGRMMGKAYAQELQQRLMLDVELLPPSEAPAALEGGGMDRGIQVATARDGAMESFFVVPDAAGNATLTVRVSQPSSILLAGESQLRFFLGLSGAFAVLVVLAGTFLVELLVIGRLRQLTRSASRAEQTGMDDLHRRFLAGKDEVSTLGRATKTMVERLRASQLLYRAVVETQSDLIFRCREDGELIFCNNAFAKALGSHSKSLVGANLHELFHGRNCKPDFSSALRQAVLEKAPIEVTMEYAREDGEPVTMLWNLRALPKERKGEMEIQAVGHDITLRLQYEESLKTAKAAAEAADRAKTEFLAILGHEVRTPLSGVMGFVSVLEKTRLTEDQREYVRMIENSGQVISALMNDLQDYSLVRDGKLQLQERDVEVGALLREVIGMHLPTARAKGIDLDLDSAFDLPHFIKTDPMRLRQVLLNLVDNGIKFTTRGFVRLSARSSIDDHIEFAVQDTGCGLSAEARARLFQPFSHLEEQDFKSLGGAGIGLFVCKRIVDQMGGTISVKSEEKLGSVFTIALPVKAGLPKPRMAREEGESGAPSATPPQESKSISTRLADEQVQVLIVEDNVINSRVAARMVEFFGVTPDIAENGRECLALVARKHYDIILMDLQMPEVDGLEATRQIRAMEASGRKPLRSHVVACTAFCFPEDRKRSDEAGMDGFLSKPLNLADVQKLFEEYLASGDQQRSAGDAAAAEATHPFGESAAREP